MAATHSRKPGPGRPKGALNKRTLELGGPLTKQKQKVTRALLDKVAPDRDLAMLMWLCALKAKNDPRYIPAMLAVAERKWGRVKFEGEHENPTPIELVVDLSIPYVARAMGMPVRVNRLLPASTARDEPPDPDGEPSKN